MKILPVTDPSFQNYGQILTGYELGPLLDALEAVTPLPEGTVYQPEQAELMALPAAAELSRRAYGGMPIQIGWCNGHNTKLNCLEYHRDSELNAGTRDFILLVAKREEMEEGRLHTDRVRAYLCPAGTMVELYATTLHYAPCSAGRGEGFKVAIVLPKGTNLDLDREHKGGEDGHLTAKNKWLLGHPEGGLPEGSPMGLIGKNLNCNE